MSVPPRIKGLCELSQALKRCRGPLASVALFSAGINVLMLTGTLFMLQVYDRVIPSGSVPTLVSLALLAAGLFIFQGILEIIRSRMLVRVGDALHERLAERVFKIILRLPLEKRQSEGLQPMRDLDQVRGAVSGGGVIALFDMPWMPFYVAICFLFHPLIGWTVLGGGALLVILTFMTDVLSRKPSAESMKAAGVRHVRAEAGRRNAEAIHAMGMGPELLRAWSDADRAFLAANRKGSDVTGGFGAASKVMRIGLQSAVLGVGAYLVIYGQATAGVIIAASILSARALAPIELAIGNWKSFVAGRQSWARLKILLAALPESKEPHPLPAPSQALSVDAVTLIPPGEQRIVVRDIGFALKAGSALGVVGPSGSGKSCLARALVGVWRPVRGKVRLDQAALDQWTPEALGRHIGYLPQDVELFDGTVAQNICRFREDDDPELVVKAAKQAGVHDLVVHLPQGYETPIGEGGAALSGGQRQRVGLARALYGDPFLVVLDEPNSNLDPEGEQALLKAIASIRERGGIAIIIAHRPAALAAVDMVLVMAGGEAKAFGPRDEVLRPQIQSVRPASQPQASPAASTASQSPAPVPFAAAKAQPAATAPALKMAVESRS